MNEKVKSILSWLEEAQALIVDGSPLLSEVKVWDIPDAEPDDVIVTSEWVDDEGLVFVNEFTLKALEDSSFNEDGHLILASVQDPDITIKAYAMTPLPAPCMSQPTPGM